MATMTIRTTVAFDPTTVARWERLAKRWGVSKSETLRRALESAENALQGPADPISNFAGMPPLQILDWLRKNPSPPVPGGWGDDPHRELREADAKIEKERERKRLETKAGEAIILCERNKPFAEIRPLPAPKRKLGLMKGWFPVSDDFNEPDPELEEITESGPIFPETRRSSTKSKP